MKRSFPAFPALPATLRGLFAALVLLCGVMPARAAAQDVHLLVVTGVSGDDEHAAQFQKWAGAVIDSAKKHGVLDANIAWLGEAPDKDKRISARASKDGVTKAFSDLATKAKPNDEVFVVLIGHGSFDGKTAAFNLPGPDLTAEEYDGLL